MAGEFEDIVQQQGRQLKNTVRQIFSALEPTPLGLALENSLLELFRHNASVVEQIAARLEKEEDMASRPAMPTIITTLAPQAMEQELAKAGLYPMPGAEYAQSPQAAFGSLTEDEGAKPGRQLAFLRASLRELEKYCYKPYRGQQNGVPFRYRLKPAFAWKGVENTLWLLAQLYKVETPLLFSPWARRAVLIEYLDGFTPANDQPVDLRLAENELEDILLTDSVLYWNGQLETCESGNVPSSAPDGDRDCYTTEYDDGIDDNTYVLPVVLDRQLLDRMHVKRQPGKIRIESPASCGTDYYKIILAKPRSDKLPEGLELFSNACDFAILNEEQRPRSIGQINRLLFALKQGAFMGSYAQDPAGAPLQRYNTDQAYPLHHAEKLFAARKDRIQIYIAFEGPDLFLADYANYALNFLQQRYPEYTWIGVPK